MTSTSSTMLFDQQVELVQAVIALRHGMADHLRKRVVPHLDPDARDVVLDTIEFLEEEEDIGINLLCLVDIARAEVRKAIAAGTSKKRVPIPRERLIGIEEAYDGRASDELHELVNRIVVHWDEDARGHWLEIEGNLAEVLRKSAPRELDAVRGDAIFAEFGCGSRI